jgi:hypothetical protein
MRTQGPPSDRQGSTSSDGPSGQHLSRPRNDVESFGIRWGKTMKAEDAPFYVFDTHADAKAVIQALLNSGFDVKKLSLVGKGYHSEQFPVGFYTVGDQIKAWGGIGAFWGGVWGFLLAPAVFFLPGLGLLAMAGPVVTALVAALEGAAVMGGMSALGSALTQIGIAKDQVILYESALKVDKYVLMVHGRAEDAASARRVVAQLKLRQPA